jgi:tetratricopeptide (TPR) repeat protein
MRHRCPLLGAVFLGVSGFAAVAAANNWEICLKAEGDYDSVITGCTSAIDSGNLHDPDLAIAYVNRAVALSAGGYYEKAIQDYKKAIELDPTNEVAFYDMANTLISTHDYDYAIENYGIAIKLRPDYANAFNNRCAAYNLQGFHDRAIEDCDKAISLNPKRANFFVGRANAYLNKGNYDSIRIAPAPLRAGVEFHK